MKMVKMMRAKLMATAAAITMVAGNAYAADLYTPTYVPPINDPVYKQAPLVVGHLEIGTGFVSIDSEDEWLFEGAGRANINLAGSWNLQIETGGASLILDDGFSVSSIGVAAHAWTKLNSAAVGVYGGVNFPTTSTIFTLGVEGEAYFGNFTVGGDVDYNWTDGVASGNDFWSASVWADAYLNPNWRVGGEFEYFSDGFDVWVASLDTEYRFGGPISGWANVAYVDASSGGFSADGWLGMLGVRVFMDGNMSLIDHDRNVPWESGLLGPDQLGP